MTECSKSFRFRSSVYEPLLEEQAVEEKVIKSMSEPEKTYIMIKPDGVQRRLVGRIIQRFEDKGLQLCALKMILPNQALLQEHYSDLKERPFFQFLMEYIR